jgi:hypothetical protein
LEKFQLIVGIAGSVPKCPVLIVSCPQDPILCMQQYFGGVGNGTRLQLRHAQHRLKPSQILLFEECLQRLAWTQKLVSLVAAVQRFVSCDIRAVCA